MTAFQALGLTLNPEDYLVNSIALYCPIDERSDVLLLPTPSVLCAAARMGIGRLARSEINDKILKLPGWTHSADPAWAEECERRYPVSLPGTCDPIFYQVFERKVQFPVSVVQNLSKDLLRDPHVLVIGLRTKMPVNNACPPESSSVLLETGPITEIFPPEETGEPAKTLEFYYNITVYLNDNICIERNNMISEGLVEKMTLFYAQWLKPLKINILNDHNNK